MPRADCLFQPLQFTGAAFDGIRRDEFILLSAELLGVDGIQESFVRRHSEEEWILNVSRAVQWLQRTCLSIERERMNARLVA